MSKKLLTVIGQLEKMNQCLIESHQKAQERIRGLIMEQQKLLNKKNDDYHLFAEANHTLGNSLTILWGNIWAISKKIPAGTKKVFTKELRLIEKVLEQLLQISQIEATPLYPAKRLDLSSLLIKITAAVRTPAHRWETRIAPKIYINGWPDELEIVFINLLENAQKYTPRQKKICCTLEQNNKNALVHIKDKGCGIPAGETKKIFQEFWRSPQQKNGKKQGSGLGLSLAEKIAKKHQGRIEVDSTEGEGTLFTVILPLA